jgi:hypothetical protein
MSKDKDKLQEELSHVRQIEHLIEKGARQVSQGHVDRNDPPDAPLAQSQKHAHSEKENGA